MDGGSNVLGNGLLLARRTPRQAPERSQSRGRQVQGRDAGQRDGSGEVARSSIMAGTSRHDAIGAQRESSRPRVTSTIEEAVLLIIGRGLAVRLDGCDFCKRRLNRGTLIDRLEPACQ